MEYFFDFGTMGQSINILSFLLKDSHYSSYVPLRGSEGEGKGKGKGKNDYSSYVPSLMGNFIGMLGSDMIFFRIHLF